MKALDRFGTRLDREISKELGVNFFRYEREALGDAVTERVDGMSRPTSYLKFKNKYEADHEVQQILEPARQFVEKLEDDKIRESLKKEGKSESLIKDLVDVLRKLQKETEIPVGKDLVYNLKREIKDKSIFDGILEDDVEKS